MPPLSGMEAIIFTKREKMKKARQKYREDKRVSLVDFGTFPGNELIISSASKIYIPLETI